MSSDGKYQTAAGGGYAGGPTTNYTAIYVSNDYGNTWVSKTGTSVWFGITMSSDGKYQYAVTNTGGVGSFVKSSDYGNTWTTISSNLGSSAFNSISTSADGRFIIACRATGDGVYISSDYGNTWVTRSATAYYNSVAVSDNGKYMVAGIGQRFVSTGGIYFSSDYGTTWKLVTPSSQIWTVAMSSNAKYVIGTSSYNSLAIHIFKADELIDGNLTINNNLTLPSGDFYSYSATGINSGEFGLIGWRNNEFVIGSQRTTSGILRDVTLTGNNININASGALIINNTNPVGGNNFVIKDTAGNNSLYYNPTQNGNAGALFSNYIYSSNIGSRGNDDFVLMYGGGGTKSIKFYGYDGSVQTTRAIIDSTGNFGIGSGISSVPSRFYVSGNSLLQGNLTTSGSGIFTSGIDLNNSKLINATPDLLNVSANFNITGTQNSRVILANSPTIITGSIVSGNPIGFNTSIIQIGSGQVLITGIGSNVIVNSYNNQFRTAAQYATISILHTGNDAYIMYGNTST